MYVGQQLSVEMSFVNNIRKLRHTTNAQKSRSDCEKVKKVLAIASGKEELGKVQ